MCQVIVIPIFWNKRAEEKAGVLAVAEEVNAMLTEASPSHMATALLLAMLGPGMPLPQLCA